MSQNYSLHFFLKKPKPYKEGEKAIYLRITVNGCVPKYASMGRMCNPELWLSRLNRVKGAGEKIKTLNLYLEAIERRFESIHNDFTRLGDEFTAEAMVNKYLGKLEKKNSLLNIFTEHNRKMKELIGKEFKSNTLKGYHTSLQHLTAYLSKDYGFSDIEVEKINHAFITGYDFYLRTVQNCSGVSVAKYMKHFRKIINLCLAHKWIVDNPFTFYKTKAVVKDREFLSKEELFSVESRIYTLKRLELVRDIFVFCCYTGLSYADIKKLKRSEIRKGDDGKLWIFTTREKTLSSSNVPLLQSSKFILDKYVDDPKCELDGMAFPVLSNQKMNSYLKEIADISGITKELTFHIARHTFATTVTLSNDVPIETVSKMLGHRDIKTTQHYAKVLDGKIGKNMAVLESKLCKNKMLLSAIDAQLLGR
jgi:site-specific recombinase XerD